MFKYLNFFKRIESSFCWSSTQALNVCDDRATCKTLLKLNFLFLSVLARCCFSFELSELRERHNDFKNSTWHDRSQFFERTFENSVECVSLVAWIYWLSDDTSFKGNCFKLTLISRKTKLKSMSKPSLKLGDVTKNLNGDQVQNCNLQPVHLK